MREMMIAKATILHVQPDLLVDLREIGGQDHVHGAHPDGDEQGKYRNADFRIDDVLDQGGGHA